MACATTKNRRRSSASSNAGRVQRAPRLFFAFDWLRWLCANHTALPPPRLRLVALGFLPELRFSPRLFPASGPTTFSFRLVMPLNSLGHHRLDVRSKPPE